MLGEAFAHIRAASGKAGGVYHNPGIIIENGAYAVNTGRPVGFQSAPGRDSAIIVNLLNVLAGLAWQGDSAAATRSASELAKWAASDRDTVASTFRSAAYLAAGLWAFSHGDTAGVESARSSLRKLRAPPESPWLLTTPMIHEKLLEAHVAVARKATDARARLEELDSLLMDSPVNRNYVLNPGNLLVSQLWERLGDDERAWKAVGRHHMNLGLSAFASARLRASARIAERLGKRDAAVAALRTYVAIRAKADAAHQADLRDARATLARLERENPGR
jgi:hypothetical protein